MTLNGSAVYSYNVTEDILTICVAAASINDAKSLISENMVLKDGVGNDFMLLNGFCDIKRTAYIESLGAYEIVVQRKSEAELQLAALQGANAQLNTRLNAAIKSNAFLEECIVEMAQVIYG